MRPYEGLPRTHGKLAPVVIGQRQASAPQLPTQDAVLFKEVAEYVSLLAVQPPGEDGEQQLKHRGVHHGGHLYHGLGFHALSRPSIQPRDITASFRSLTRRSVTNVIQRQSAPRPTSHWHEPWRRLPAGVPTVRVVGQTLSTSTARTAGIPSGGSLDSDSRSIRVRH